MIKRNPGKIAPITREMRLYDWGVLSALCVMALRIGLTIYDTGFSSYDDGVAAEGARRILHGNIPYRDFWSMYAPGAFYANALAMRLFGESMLSVRLIGPLCGVIQAILLFLIMRKVVQSKSAAILCAVVFLTLIPLGSQTLWFTVLLAAVYMVVRLVLQPDSIIWSYLCGLTTAFVALFRQDAGAYAALAVFPMIYMISSGSIRQRIRPLARALGAYIAVIGAAALYFGMNGALPDLFYYAFRFPIVEFPGSRPLPYPVPGSELLVIGPFSAPISILFFYQLFGFYLLPSILAAAGIVGIIRMVRGRDVAQIMFVVLIVIAIALYLMVRIRPSGARIIAGAMIGMIAFAQMASNNSRFARIAAFTVLVSAIIAFAPFGLYSILAHNVYAQSIIPQRGGLRTAPGHAEQIYAASIKVRELTSPGDSILSGSPAVYFLADREPVTKFYEPHPRVTDTLSVQRRIINDMERNRTRYFVRSCEWGRDSFFTIEPEHQPEILIGYIQKNYKPVYDFFSFQIYERK